jgi:hypothetical protein
VTGLWWHTRAKIRSARAYGLTRILKESSLQATDLRVKRLSDEIAVVHAHEAHWLGVSRRDHRAAAPLERAVIRRSSDAGGLAMRRRQLPIELLRRQLRDQERAGEADQRRRSTRAFAAQERGPSRARMNEFAFHQKRKSTSSRSGISSPRTASMPPIASATTSPRRFGGSFELPTKVIDGMT